MQFREIKTTVRPRSYGRECLMLLHLPRFAIIIMFILVGTFLAPRVDFELLAWELVAIFFGVALAAYRLDEYKDGTTSVTIPRNHHLLVAAYGLTIMVAIGIFVIESTSRWLYVPFALGLCGVVLYNLDVWPFKSKLFYAFVWGGLPVIGSYVLQTLSMPPLSVIAFAVAVSSMGLSTLWIWGLRTCGRAGCCRKYKDWAHATHECHSPIIDCYDRLTMPKEINDHAKVLLNLDFISALFLTIMVVMRYYEGV